MRVRELVVVRRGLAVRVRGPIYGAGGETWSWRSCADAEPVSQLGVGGG